MIPQTDAPVDAATVAGNVDRFLASLNAAGRWRLRLALRLLGVYPLVFLKRPLWRMPVERRRRFLQRHLVDDVAERRVPEVQRVLAQAMMRAVHQLVCIGYYGDTRVHDSVGYLPFRRRAEGASTGGSGAEAGLVLMQDAAAATTLSADVAIVGSGAAGAVLAYRLAERGREVLLIERGPYLPGSSFTEDEPAQISRLYRGGAIQPSDDSRFSVLQAQCVGGSTVVNNGICFDPPVAVLEAWNDRSGPDAGIELGELVDSVRFMRSWLPVMAQTRDPKLFSGGALRFAAGIAQLGLDREPYSVGVVDANIAGCRACGQCTIGCGHGAKLSMEASVLPRAQRDFGHAAVRIAAGLRAERIETRRGLATAVHCRRDDGSAVTVRASTIVVAGGALHSSALLQRSNVGGPLVGRGVAFNMASPITAEFAERLESFRGLPISHYLIAPPEAGYMLEDWFNPVMTQSLFVPGWLGDHYLNMRRYAHMACAGVVVGTAANARVRATRRGGVRISYHPRPEDLGRLRAGLKTLSRIFLAAGALRVLPATYGYAELREDGDVEAIDELLRDHSDILLSTSHPFGGNSISRDPAKGVVDSDFKVHGSRNLYVCDASVFPSSITVNPQLTVMALAHYASRRVT